MDKFIQDRAYLSEGHLKVYTPEKLDKDITYNVLLIDSESTPHEKLTALLNVVADMAGGFDINKKEYNSTVNKNGVDLKTVEMLRTFSRFIGYLGGCSSWRNKNLENFDKVELEKRLEHLKLHFKT